MTSAEERARIIVDEDDCSCDFDGRCCDVYKTAEQVQWHCCLWGAAVWHLRAHAAAKLREAADAIQHTHPMAAHDLRALAEREGRGDE